MWISRKMEKGLIPEVAKMTEEYYGPENDIAVPEYLEYEYYSNPAGDVRMEVAWNEELGEVGGQYAAIPIYVKVGDSDRLSLLSVNTLTKDTYRGQGVFKILANEVYEDAIKEGFAIVYGMPNQNSRPGFCKYIGFSDISDVPLYLRPLKPSGMVKGFLNNNFLAALAKPFNIFFKAREYKKSDAKLVDFKASYDKYADIFWDNVRNKFPVMITRNKAYIKYRFVDIPRRDYTGYYAISNGEVVGYAIGRVTEVAGMKCAMVADFLFVSGHEKAAKKMLRRLLVDLMHMGADVSGCMVSPNSEEAKMIRNMGFFRCPKKFEPIPFRFIFRQLDTTDDSLKIATDFKNWFFTMGDFDDI